MAKMEDMTIQELREDAIVKEKFNAKFLQYFTQGNSQSGMTFVNGLLVIMFLAIFAPIPLRSLLSQESRNSEIQAIVNVKSMNDYQGQYFSRHGEFADETEKLNSDLDRPKRDSSLSQEETYDYSSRPRQNQSHFSKKGQTYEYSIGLTHFAAFQYATTLKEDRRSYLGIAIKVPNQDYPKNNEARDKIGDVKKIFVQTIYYCEQDQPGSKPSEPILQDGRIQCGENMTGLGEPEGVHVGKDWELAFRAWEFASQEKYDRALELAQSITDRLHKASALEAIAHEFIAAGDSQGALQLAATIMDDWYQAKVLSEVSPFLSNPEQYDLVLELVATMTDEKQKAEVLKAIYPHLSSEEQSDRALEIAASLLGTNKELNEKNTDAQIFYDNHLGETQFNEVLAAIAPYLSETEYNRVLELVETIANEWRRSQASIAIAPYLSNEAQYKRILELADPIKDEASKSHVLKAIALHFIGESQYDRALSFTLSESSINAWNQSEIIKEIIPHLTSEDQYDRVLLYLTESSMERWGKNHVLVLEQIIPHLTSEAQYNRVLELAETMTDDRQKSEVLKAIAPHLTTESQYNRALEVAKTIKSNSKRKEVLEAIAHGNSQSLLIHQ